MEKAGEMLYNRIERNRRNRTGRRKTGPPETADRPDGAEMGAECMIQVDLITGFLGAGKSTFLLRYADELLRRGCRLGILVYDHGAVNVDMPLLQQLRQKGCEMEMLLGGCDADCHRRRFRTKLIAMGMSGFDRIVIEPSGVFDMDEFFDTLREPPLDRWFEAGNVITVVDARLEEDSSPEEDFFLASQAACAGCVLLSRCQLASPEEIAGTLEHLRRASKGIRCRAPEESEILAKDWAELTAEDFERLLHCGYRMPDYVKTVAGGPDGFQALSFLDLPLDGKALRDRTQALFQDSRYGRILRVKGFFREGENCFQLNATAKDFQMEPVPFCRGALLVIGSGLDEDAIGVLLTGRAPEHHLL